MVIYIIIIIFIVLYLYKYNQNINQLNENLKHRNNMGYKNFKNSSENNCKKPLLTNYDCFINKCDLCPMSSFKQCSNNYSYKNYPPNTNCSCYSISQDLCKNKYSQKCLVTNHICNSKAKEKKIIDYPVTNPRVNLWNTSENIFSNSMF